MTSSGGTFGGFSFPSLEDKWSNDLGRSPLNPPRFDKERTVPVGTLDSGELYRMTFSPKAGDYHHLLVTGGTGSGKTVFTDTLAAALMSRYSQGSAAQFIFFDGKGSAGPIAEKKGVLYHLTPDKSEDAALAAKSIQGFLQHQSEQLDEANGQDIQDLSGILPYLFLFVDEPDEFGPEVQEMLDKVYRVGRSLGVYIIRSQQRNFLGTAASLSDRVKLVERGVARIARPGSEDSVTVNVLGEDYDHLQALIRYV